MNCRTYGDLSVDCNTTILEGGYVIEMCSRCTNDFQIHLYENFSMDKLSRLHHLQSSEELTEEQAKRFLEISRELFFFAKDWVDRKIGNEDIGLMRVGEMWETSLDA